MAITAYPQGVSSFGIPVIGSGSSVPVSTGQYFFVSNSPLKVGQDATTRGKTPTDPFKTIAYAVTQCTANRSDVIVVMPGHVETITSATSFTITKAGISIIGLGVGSNRPTIQYTTATTASLVISAANVFIQNVIFDMAVGAVDAIAVGITLTGANFRLFDCKVTMADASNQGVVFLSVGSGASDCHVSGLRLDATAGAGAAEAILFAAAVAGFRMNDSYIAGDFSNAVLYCTSTNHATEMRVSRNALWQRNGTAKAVINLTNSSTGLFEYNTLEGTTWTTVADAIANTTSVSMRFVENYGGDDSAGFADKSALLTPAVGTIS
jgi:hypothetical protein